MKIKALAKERFSDFYLPSMLVAFPHCSFKCEKDCGIKMCQNSGLVNQPTIDISIDDVIKEYLSNPIHAALVYGGLEPFDSFGEMLDLSSAFRRATDAPIVIYTGYYACELEYKLASMMSIKNIYVKFGRYIPNQKPHYDNVLGVYLASDNQYGQKIT